ncbi:MAG: DUF1963 domain-containing protein [Pirellulales bacterium]|nr:DUF1963 domain-containing protein [Pirellulales bacterium]
MIASPAHIAIIEQIRDECEEEGPFEQEVPTDLFLFARGQPPRRDLMQIGGVPYRPADMPWPRTSTGQAMTFLAQFRFAESLDICPAVPAGMLLVFARDNMAIDGDPDSFRVA